MDGWHDAEFPTLVASQFETLSEIAADLAEAIIRPGSLQRDSAVERLLRIALVISEAQVASCRLVGRGEILERLGDELWEGTDPVGRVPKSKHRDDCRPNLTEVACGRRDPNLTDQASARRFYTESEIAHFAWLGSEAFIPLVVNEGMSKAIIVLGHSDPDHFNADRENRLRRFHGFFNAFYALSDFVDDRVAKSRILQDTARVLPKIVAASSRRSFARAICALLTCEYGFGFERAMFFWMKDGRLPAECDMAIGGTASDWPAKIWKRIEAKKAEGRFRSLADYINESMASPIPLGPAGDDGDPLFSMTCGHPNGFFLYDDDIGRAFMTEVVAQQAKRPVPKISARGNSPGGQWLRNISLERKGVFRSETDEYFVFELRPFGADAQSPALGFVIADLGSRPQPHTPGLDNPDLVMTQFALNLLAGLWRFREEAETYFHILAAWPILSHRAPELVDAVRLFRVRQEAGEDVSQDLTRIEDVGRRLSQVKDIVEAVKKARETNTLPDVAAGLAFEVERARKKHRGNLTVMMEPSDVKCAIRMSQDSFAMIIECILDNAVYHRSYDSGACVRIRLRNVGLPGVGGKVSRRVEVVFENERDEITADLVPYLFVDGVTTDPVRGQGSGLSAARRIAEAHGGDVVLTSAKPVRFAVILEPKVAPKE